MKLEPQHHVWFVWHLVRGSYYTGVFNTYDEAKIAYDCATKYYTKVYLQHYCYRNDERNLTYIKD